MKLSVKYSCGALLCGLLSTLTSNAGASTTFPPKLQQELGLSSLPYPPLGCQLCHKDDVGGYMTAIKPFGRAVFAAGAMGGSVPSLLTALDALDANGTDSDRDGTADIAELRAGTDPNVAATVNGEPPPPVEDIPLPQTGCALGSAPSEGASPALFGVSLGLLLLGRRRRR